MPKISRIELVQQNEQPVLAIRTMTSIEKLPQLIGESYQKMADYLAELGECLSDVPFVAYHNMDMHHLDVEIGFPVMKKLPDKGDLKSGCIPESRSISCMCLGPYGDIEPTYNEMAEFMKQNGYEPTGTAYEYYYNDSDFPEKVRLTKIVMPIK